MSNHLPVRILLLACALSCVAGGPKSDVALRAGAAAVDVSPTTLPVNINGNFLAAAAAQVSDPLYARALVLDDGKTRLAICAVDSCLMPRDLLDEAKAAASKTTGIPTDRMLVSATHCHSAPAAMGILGTDVDPHYPPVLKKGIAAAIERANANLAPAAVAWGVADAGDYTGCRRWIRRSDRLIRDPFGDLTGRANMHPGFQSPDAIGPSGPSDPDLTVLSVRTPDGRPVALLANFAMHYFATGVKPVSADYFGVFNRRVAELLNAGPDGATSFVSIMSQGTSGDQWRVDYGKPQPKITVDEYADALAKKAVEAVAKAPHQFGVSLAMKQTTIRVKARGPSPERLAAAKKVVAEMGDRLPKTVPEVYAREQVYLSERPEADMVLQAIRVGDFGIAALPNEVYALTGLKIKAQSPLAATMNVELANDELGYIPPPEQHKLGGYTTWPARSSYPDVDSEPKMVEAVLRLLEDVAGKPRRVVTDAFGAYAVAVMVGKPLACWRGTDMSGPAAADATNNYPGKYEDGVVFYLPGPDSPAFSGEGHVNRCPHYAGGRMRADLRDLGPTYSVELWFWNGLPADARPVAGYLFSRGRDGDKDGPGDHLGVGGTHVAAGRLIFYPGGGAPPLAGRTTIAPKTWNHVALVREDKKVAVYLNGNTTPEVAGEPGGPSDATQVFVGGRCDNFANFEGKIDEVAVYGRALAADEVAKHFKASGMPLPPPATQPSAATQPTSRPTIPAPKSPAESLKALHVKDGYEVELVAAEPLVMDPVAIAFGPDGKLWVAEMADYPYGSDGKMKPAGRIRYLEDTDGDGKYDKSTLFLDEVNFPTGVMPWRKGVIVTAAPEIFYAEDTDGDGKADVRRPLYTGFTQGNPQLRVNGPTWGFDNWVYVANGMSSRGKVRSVQTGKEVDVGGHDLRIRPDTGNIETETGLTEFGRNRDDWGDWFGCDNSHPMWHFVLSDRYTRRNPFVAPAKPTDGMGLPSNPPVYQLTAEGKRYHSFEHAGHYTSACSATVYRDELLFPRREHERDAFVCEPVHNLVQHLVLKEAGVTFVASHRDDEKDHDFFASEDPWCRPVFVTTGADGALWVVDMYRYMIEHPDWLPDQGKEEYRPFYRAGADRGRIYRIYPKGRRPLAVPRMDKLSVEDLAAALDSPNGWERDVAHQQIIWQADKALAKPLGEALHADRGRPINRLHALGALDGLNELTAAQVEQALRDEHPAVRRFALQLAEPRAASSPRLIGPSLDLRFDRDPKVRLQLACTLGQWDDPRAGEALAGLAAGGGDGYMAAAVMSSAPRHFAALAAAVAASPDPFAAPAYRDLLDMALAKSDRAAVSGLLAPVLSAKGGRYSADQFETAGRFLDRLAQHKQSLATLAEAADDDLSRQLAGAAGMIDAARRSVADAARPANERAAAAGLLCREPDHAADDVTQLTSLLAPQTPAAVQRAAVASIARAGDDRVPDALLKGWPSQSPEIRSAAADVLLGREPWAFRLLSEIEAGRVAAGQLDAARRQRLLRHNSARVKALAEKLLGAPADAGRSKVVEAYRPALSMPGDPGRGAKVFAAHCATCHRVGDVGQDVGPDLRSVRAWTPDMLLTSILDPNRAVEPRFLSYTAVLNDGETVFGVVTAESDGAIAIKGLDGKERGLPRADIRSLECNNRSLMPDGLEAQVGRQDMADLVRFLIGPRP